MPDEKKLNEGDHWNVKCVQYFSNDTVNRSLTYIKKIVLKLIESLMSIKLWIIGVTIAISTWLVMNNFITGDNLSSIWIGVVTPIAIMRESFKISRVFGDLKQKAMDMMNKPEEPK